MGGWKGKTPTGEEVKQPGTEGILEYPKDAAPAILNPRIPVKPDNIQVDQLISPDYYKRNLAEYMNLSQGIYSKTKNVMDLMQGLEWKIKERQANFNQAIQQRRIEQQRLDLEAQKKIGKMGLEMLPTATDRLFQAGLSGIMAGYGTWKTNKAYEEHYNNMMRLLGYGNDDYQLYNRNRVPPY